MQFVILHLGTEVSLKGILGGIDVDEQYKYRSEPAWASGHLQTF